MSNLDTCLLITKQKTTTTNQTRNYMNNPRLLSHREHEIFLNVSSWF